jgi:scyllo-inositol 2-dehydrogenase (NADP+)
MNSPTQLSAGLIGFGLAGRYFHTPLLLAAGIDIAAVVTSRTDEVRSVLPNAMVMASAQALFDHTVALIVIATPNDQHAQQAAAALRAGKHVVVDKPLSVTSAEAWALHELARQCNRVLGVFQNRRWDSDFLTIRQLLGTGRLGEVNAFHARWDRFRPTVADRWRERDEPGSGILYDLGSHLIDQALCLFGSPQWLQADVFTQRSGAVAADGFEILMGKDQLRISLGASSIAAPGDWRYRVHGARASYFKEGLDPQEAQLRSGVAPDADAFGVELAAQHGRLVTGADGQTQPIESQRGRWLTFYDGIRNSIERGAPVPVGADEAAATIGIIEAVLRSSATGRRVTLV